MKLLKLLFSLAALALAAEAQSQRMLCLFFDLNSLSAPDQLRAQASAIKFVQEQTTATDLISVMTFTSEVKVVQDFSSDREALLAALRGIIPSTASAATGDAESRLRAIQDAAAMLGPVAGKKAMIYFSSATPAFADSSDQLRAAVNATVRANVAIYPVDARSLAVPNPPQR